MKEACKTGDQDLTERGWKTFDCFGGKTCLIIKRDEAYFGYVNRCPHMGGPVAPEADSAGTLKLKCAWHGAVFDLKTGRAETPPAPAGSSLRPISLTIENETIFYT